jgi:glycosyltransferase involved in cell wall biosynthesis
MNQQNWICCQLGAREHYAIPRALHQTGQLSLLITDAWVGPNSPLNLVPVKSIKGLCDRYHSDLENAPIKAFNNKLIGFEIQQRLEKTEDWDRMIARNQWFQAQVINTLETINIPRDREPPILFTYSYASLEILKYAKNRGWPTILGQIDPGIEEEKIVIAEKQKYPHLAPDWHPVPPSYWEIWQQECALADRVMVNSQWSKQLLEQANIEAEIEIVPLVYEPPPEAANFTRTYPEKFTHERPLRVLFLGLINLRKGVAHCLEAIEQLTGEPIEFWFVGAIQIEIPEHLRNHPQIRWIGSVPRSETYHYYQKADVFLFPTLSDGFGLTQLEALAWKLPVIASPNCGTINNFQSKDLMINTISSQKISNVLLQIIEHPQKLQQYVCSTVTVDTQNYTLSKSL